MKVEVDSKGTISFKNIPVGDTFQWMESFYMKVNLEHSEYDFGAVNLKIGHLFRIENDVQVTPIKLKVVEE